LGHTPIGDRLELNSICGCNIVSASPSEPYPRIFNGIVNIREDDCFDFYIPMKRVESVRFAFCRGLCEYLFLSGPNPALLTAAESERQSRNRAFAAELLAPADGIRKHLQDSVVTEEDVDELATHFVVSTYVIQHQIKNHRLAKLVEA
jgi:hypothetical protein